MSHRLPALAAALTLVAATLGQAGAAEPVAQRDQPTFTIPAVIGAAYHQRNVAVNAVEVRRQGGLLVPGATQWLPAATEPTFTVAAFSVPAVIGAAHRERNVALNAGEVRQQGGFTTAAAVQWLPAAPAIVDAKAQTVQLGAL